MMLKRPASEEHQKKRCILSCDLPPHPACRPPSPPGQGEKGLCEGWGEFCPIRSRHGLDGRQFESSDGERQSPDLFRMTGGSVSPFLMNIIDTEFTQCRVFLSV